MPTDWAVYLLECCDGSLYCGITTNIQRRVNEHNQSSLAAKYTRTRRPVKLVYQETVNSRAEASKREYAIKRLSKKQKLALINLSLGQV